MMPPDDAFAGPDEEGKNSRVERRGAIDAERIFDVHFVVLEIIFAVDVTDVIVIDSRIYGRNIHSVKIEAIVNKRRENRRHTLVDIRDAIFNDADR